jgi:hypothetical protein
MFLPESPGGDNQSMTDDRDETVRATLATLRSVMQPMPHPQNTCEFPAGLISDYIKIVDRLRKEKEKKTA